MTEGLKGLAYSQNIQFQALNLIQHLKNSHFVEFTPSERKPERQHWCFRKATLSSSRWLKYFTSKKPLEWRKHRKLKRTQYFLH